MEASPGFQQIAPALQQIMLTTLAAGPAGGCVHGHGAAGRIVFANGVAQILIWMHGRAPDNHASGGHLQVGDELELGTIGDVLAAGNDDIAAAVIQWLMTVHKKPDRGLGWTPCSSWDLLGGYGCDGLCEGHTPEDPCQNPHHRIVIGTQACTWETQREDGVCWHHAPPTQREIDFGSIGTLMDRPQNGAPVT